MLGVITPPHASPAPVYGKGGDSLVGFAITPFAGQYKVEGHTLLTGTLAPLYRKVRLMTMEGVPVRGKMSVTATGAFSFIGVAAGKYIVLGIDQDLSQNAVVAALVDAVVM
jgi:hypothetical protein